MRTRRSLPGETRHWVQLVLGLLGMAGLIAYALLVSACTVVPAPKDPVPPTPPSVRLLAATVRTPDNEPVQEGVPVLHDESDPPHVAACAWASFRLICDLREIPYGVGVRLTIDGVPGMRQFSQRFEAAPDLGELRLQPQRAALPPPPSKRELMEAQYTFQGLRATCPQYDPRPIPIFDPMRDVVDDACRAEIDRAHREAGDKVIGVALSHQYAEPGVIPVLQWGKDWSQDLPGLRAYIEDIIRGGFYVQLHLAGDGHSVKDANGRYVYNDPVGHTYGCEWLIDTFPQIADALDGLEPYIRFLPGYDGVFYGCEDDIGDPRGPLPVKIPAFAKQFKMRWPNAVLGIEFNTGHLPFGEGDADWLPGGRMQDFDMVFAEFDGNLDQDSTWQIVARLMKEKGQYRRPPEQPTWDDPDPPAYLWKWPGVAVCFEWATYDDVRFRMTPEQVDAGRRKLRAMGCQFVG